ncbi:cytochrome c-type protein [[Actinobacillus] rossii]|uniref:Cytochrome c-type protein n=1 Tax=[Actinobacillus] rossii TaxID=123820 RepID=A0A380TQH8_9PAST|nr:cytochrome c-type protein [[Actinobacillus] rossii]
MKNKLKAFFLKPSNRIGMGVLVTLGFIVGAISWQQFNNVMDTTNSEEFCVSCHSMQAPFEELKQTVHWKNSSGVKATCSDCHLPHDKTDKFARKIQASREVFAELTGKYKDEGAFEEHRLEMAEREWARFAANGSKECKVCHSYERMDFDKMSKAAQKAMKPAAERNQSCLDCHKGIAHHLPKKKEGREKNSKFDSLVIKKPTPAQTYYAKGNVSLFSDEILSQKIGYIETAAPVNVLKSTSNGDQVELIMWRKNKGFGRIWYNQFAKNITDAVLTKEFMKSEPHFEVLETKEDPLTGLEWQKVKLAVWIAPNQLISNVNAVWEKAENTYKTQCSTCHRQPQVSHFDSNTWIGLFKGMVGFTNIDEQTGKEVLRYLQLHSSDFDTQHHDEK